MVLYLWVFELKKNFFVNVLICVCFICIILLYSFSCVLIVIIFMAKCISPSWFGPVRVPRRAHCVVRGVVGDAAANELPVCAQEAERGNSVATVLLTVK